MSQFQKSNLFVLLTVLIYISDDVLSDRIEDLLEGKNETAKVIFKALAAFDESDWKTVRKFIDALKKDEAE